MSINTTKKTLTVDEAVQAVRSMGIADAHKAELKREYQRGYHQAIEDMRAKLDKMFLP